MKLTSEESQDEKVENKIEQLSKAFHSVQFVDEQYEKLHYD